MFVCFHTAGVDDGRLSRLSMARTPAFDIMPDPVKKTIHPFFTNGASPAISLEAELELTKSRSEESP